MQTSQKHVAPCVKVVKWGFDTRDLRMVAAFWAGILVEVTHTQEHVVVTRCRRAAIEIPLESPHTTHRKRAKPAHKDNSLTLNACK